MVGSLLKAADAVGAKVGEDVPVEVAVIDGLAVVAAGVLEITGSADEEGVDGVSNGRTAVAEKALVGLLLAVIDGGSSNGDIVGGVSIKTINPTAAIIVIDRRDGSALRIVFPLGNQSRFT